MGSVCVGQPIRQIDIRTFEHDALLIKLRFQLEEKESISNWKSDRSLRTAFSFQNGLYRDYVPDAVYQNADQDLVAFELELTIKSKKRYREKLSKYRDIMAGWKTNIPISFHKARFVCATEAIQRSLRNESSLFNDRNNPSMRFELLSDIFVAPNKDIKRPQFELLNTQYGNYSGF